MVSKHHPLYCIVPPYMLRNIAENGSNAQKSWAEKTLIDMEQVHRERSEITSGQRQLVAKTAVPGEQRVVYDAQNGSALPGIAVRREGDPPVADPAVNEAYDGAGLTYSFYSEIHSRNSIDNLGMRIDSTVHYQRSFDNAFWNGEQMVYGDGDEDMPESSRLFNRFTSALDVIGHELTHGVIQYEANLVYSFQSGALNEHFADVFGSLVKQRSLGHNAAQADWIIGAGLFTENVNGVGVRSMKAPGSAYDDPVLGKDPQPAHMDNYVNTSQDYGGVHINCGIPNLAFYTTAMELGGYAWEKAGQVWYATLRKRISSTATFQQTADMLYTVAGEMYGAGSLEQQAVQHGWAAVGINVGSVEPTPEPEPGNPGCLSSILGFFRAR